MKVLDLYAGLGGWSEAFKDRGHNIFRIDIEESFDVELHKDMERNDRQLDNIQDSTTS